MRSAGDLPRPRRRLVRGDFAKHDTVAVAHAQYRKGAVTDPWRLRATIAPPMYALFEDAGSSTPARDDRKPKARCRSLDSGKRVKVKSANVLLKFDKPQPAELIASAQTLARDIDLDLAWGSPPSRSSASLTGARLLRRRGRRRSRPPRCSACSRRRTTSAVSAGATSKKARKKPSGRAAGHRAQEGRAGADRGLGRRDRAGPVPGAGARAALQDPFKPDKNAPGVQGGGRGGRCAQQAPLELLKAAGAIDSPYQFHWKRFLFDNFPKGTGFPALAAPPIKEAAAVAGEGVLDRRLGDHRDRRRAVGAGPGHRHGGVRHPHRRAGLAIQPDSPRSTSWRASACPPSTCPAEDDHAARRRGAGLHADRKGATARRCRCTSRSTKRRSRSRPAKPGWSGCPSSPTCATTGSTR